MATIFTTKNTFVKGGVLPHNLLPFIWREPRYSIKTSSKKFYVATSSFSFGRMQNKHVLLGNGVNSF